MNENVLGLGQSPTLLIGDRVRALKAAGKNVVKLQTGDPDFDTPEPIVEAANRALRTGNTHYSNTRGLPSLREALADKLSRSNGINCDPATDVLITHGGVHAVYSTLNTLLKPGDEVLIPDPFWTPYASATTLAGGIPVQIKSHASDGFKVQPEAVAELINERTRVLLINTPANPSGAVLSRSDLEALARIAIDAGLWVVADEVYERLVYDDNEHVSIATLPGMAERTITVNSFSKTFAMTGWRLGYLCAPAHVAEEILKVTQYTVTNVSPFIQEAGLAALTDDRVADAVDEMVSSYSRRAHRIRENLSAIPGINFVDPGGAFYFLIDPSELGLSGDDFTSQLLDDYAVALVPGSGFGNSASGHARMTFAAPDAEIDEGMQRIARFAESVR
jgi:aspartate aminotransferase